MYTMLYCSSVPWYKEKSKAGQTETAWPVKSNALACVPTNLKDPTNLPSMKSSWQQCGQTISMCSPVSLLRFITKCWVQWQVAAMCAICRTIVGASAIHSTHWWGGIRNEGHFEFSWHIKNFTLQPFLQCWNLRVFSVQKKEILLWRG